MSPHENMNESHSQNRDVFIFQPEYMKRVKLKY